MGNFPVVPVKEFCLKHGISEFFVYCQVADEAIDAFVVGGRVWIGRRDATWMKRKLEPLVDQTEVVEQAA